MQTQGPPGAVQPGQPQQPIRVYFQQSQDPTALAAAQAAQQQQQPNTNPVFVHHPSANFVVGFTFEDFSDFSCLIRHNGS